MHSTVQIVDKIHWYVQNGDMVRMFALILLAYFFFSSYDLFLLLIIW